MNKDGFLLHTSCCFNNEMNSSKAMPYLQLSRFYPTLKKKFICEFHACRMCNITSKRL